MVAHAGVALVNLKGMLLFSSFLLMLHILRDRPFNLKGGGYGFLIRSEKKIPTTQELEYFFFVARSANFFSRN